MLTNQLLFTLKNKHEQTMPLNDSVMYAPLESSLMLHSDVLSFEHQQNDFVSDLLTNKPLPTKKPTLDQEASKWNSPSNKNLDTGIDSKSKFAQSQPVISASHHSRDTRTVPKAVKNSSISRKENKKRSLNYISPFILLAEQRAKERSQKALSARITKKAPTSWNGDTSAPTLFDPNLRKQEIFKIEPRKPNLPSKSKAKTQYEQNIDDNLAQRGEQSADDLVPSPQRAAQKLTIRSFGDSPIRKPLNSSGRIQSETNTVIMEREIGSKVREVEKVSTATSPSPEWIDHAIPAFSEHNNSNNNSDSVLLTSRATSPMDERKLRDLLGYPEHHENHYHQHQHQAAPDEIAAVSSPEPFQRLQRDLDRFSSPIRIPAYQSPAALYPSDTINLTKYSTVDQRSQKPSTSASKEENAHLRRLDDRVEETLREMKTAMARNLHRHHGSTESNNLNFKNNLNMNKSHGNIRHAHTSPIGQVNTEADSIITSNQMMSSVAQLITAVGGILSTGGASRSPSRYRSRQKDRRRRSGSKSRSRSSDSTRQERRALKEDFDRLSNYEQKNKILSALQSNGFGIT